MNPNEKIRSLFAGYSSDIRSKKPVVMLQAYFDDSVCSRKKRLFLAGFVSTAESWMRFSDEWAEELQRAPSINYFHMVEAGQFRDEFKGWDRADRDAKVLRLAKIIAKHQLFSLHSSINEPAAKRIYKKIAPYPFHDPYYSVFLNVIGNTIILADRMGYKGKIKFIFDEKQGFLQTAKFFETHIRETRPDYASRIAGTPSFEDDKDVMPLQAADLLAWHVRRESRPNGGFLMLREPTRAMTRRHHSVDIPDSALNRRPPNKPPYFGQTKKEFRQIMDKVLTDGPPKGPDPRKRRLL